MPQGGKSGEGGGSMKLLTLFAVFFRIGLFTFGGGYGMIPLVQQEALSRGWMDAEALYRFIGVCESTPGPIAVNMATFVGSSQAGLAGSVCATLGVVLPALLVMLLIAAVLKGFSDNRYVRAAMAGIRPVVAGMIVATGLWAALRCLALPARGKATADPRQWIVAGLLCAGVWAWRKLLKRAFSPIGLILLSAALGIVVYGV